MARIWSAACLAAALCCGGAAGANTVDEYGEWRLTCSQIAGRPAPLCALVWTNPALPARGVEPIRVAMLCGPHQVAIALASGEALHSDVQLRPLDGRPITARPNEDGVAILAGDAAVKAMDSVGKSIALVVQLEPGRTRDVQETIIPVPETLSAALATLRKSCPPESKPAEAKSGKAKRR